MCSRRLALRFLFALGMTVYYLPIEAPCAAAPLTLAIHDSDEANGNDSNLDGIPDVLGHGPSGFLLANNSPSQMTSTAVSFGLGSVPQNAVVESAVLEMKC